MEPVAKRLLYSNEQIIRNQLGFLFLPRIVLYWLLYFLILSPIIRRYQGLGRKHKSLFFLAGLLHTDYREAVGDHIHLLCLLNKKPIYNSSYI